MPSTDLPRAAVAPASVPPEGPRLAAGETVRTVGLPGLSLVVRSRTDGGPEPALCVHGLGGSSQNWSALMARLSDVVSAEAPDLPGFGHSPPPDDGNYSIPGHARAVIRLLEADGRGPVHLFGNSMGGAVAVKVAAARPDLVRTLTLISPALPEVPPQLTAWPTTLTAVPGVLRLFTRLTRDWSPERRTAGLLALCYGDPGVVDAQAREDAAAEYERRLNLPYFRDAMVRSIRGLADAYTLGGQHAPWRQAERVLAPTLLVYGGRDKLVSMRSARHAARAFRDRRLLLIPGSGHVAMMEYPGLVDRAFRDLLSDVAARRRDAGGPRQLGGLAGAGVGRGPSTDAATRS
ncbi:alpha/beta fold hydrolase [Streptomyces sp. NPDC088194]|uniref:alpha/beta fold hydrolase n=1 Tax=Streptomyces sp. NPDC088194 TaxID=3154931 RepID=UPI00344B08D7